MKEKTDDKQETKQETKQEKIVYILRGVPGSDRDIAAFEILKSNPDSVLIDAKADNIYDKKKFDSLHKLEFKKFLSLVIEGKPLIVVNHSNVRVHHYYHYVDVAQRNNYHVFIVTALVNNMSDRELARISNKDELLIRDMRKNFEWEFKQPEKIEKLG